MENYKLGLSNLGNLKNLELKNKNIFGEKFKFYQNLSSSSDFYLFDLDQLLINCSNEKKHIQYGDNVYITSIINKQIFIIGFDQISGKFLVSKFEEATKNLRNQKQMNDDSFLKKYEWSLEKVPISKEESLLSGTSDSSIPNLQSVKYNDLFTIKFNSEHAICTKDIKSGLNMQFNQLSIENISLSGRNSYWTIVPLKFEGTLYPNWFLMKKILKSKDKISLKFLDSKIIEKLTFERLNCSKSKLELVRIDNFNLVSNRPIGWDIPNMNFSEDELSNNEFSIETLNSLPSIIGFIFDHAVNGDNVKKQNIIPNKLSSFSIKIQEQLILEDILNCLMCNNGNYIRVTEKVEFFQECELLDFTSKDLYIIEFNSTLNNDKNFSLDFISVREGISLFYHKIIDDPSNLQYFSNDLFFNTINEEKKTDNNLNGFFELKDVVSTNNFKKNPSLYPLSYRTLELSSLHRRIRKFLKVHESGNSHFGIVSGTLCDSFRELLKHFTIKVTKFESYLRKGQLTIQNIWSYSQQALTTLKVLDFISTQVLYKKGHEIVDQVYKIANNEFRGEESSQKIVNFIFNQLFFSWYKHFLAPWLEFGVTLDYFSEFTDYKLSNSKKKFITENLCSQIFYREQEKKFSLVLPLFLHELTEQVNYIGLVSHLFCNLSHLYTRNQLFNKECENGDLHRKRLENILGQMLKSLSYISDSIRNEEIKVYINDMFIESQLLLFRICNSITDIRSHINSFYEIFFCANDSLIQEFIEYIYKLGFERNKRDYHSCNGITRKWNELMIKYYRDQYNSGNSNMFYCQIEKKLITEYVNEDLFKPVKWEINSYILHQELKSIQKNKLNNSKFEIFKYLTIKFCEVKTFGSIWPRELLNKYETIFRLIFHLKYINHLLNNIWIVDQTSNICDKRLNKTKHNVSINELIHKSYFLRQKMLLLITSILEYIYYDIINPLWNSMIQDFENITTLEELNSRQDQLLNEILAQCFFLEGEQLQSLYAILSLCHLFANHSNLINIYVFSDTTKTNFFHYEKKNGKSDKYEEITQMLISNTSSYKKNIFARTMGRTRINMHIESLLDDPTYNDIVEKFISKFESLIYNFFKHISNCKNQKINFMSRLVLKLNYNGYYMEKVPTNHDTWEEPTIEEFSCNNFIIES